MEFRPSRFEILPAAVKNLLIINVLVFLAQQTFDGFNAPFQIDDTFALHAWQSSLFKPWQLITHLFMHGSWSHIFFNMLALWMFGAVLENVWGTKRFLVFYLVSGLGAALIHLLFLSYETVSFINDYNLIVQENLQGNGQVAELVKFIQKHKEIPFSNPGALVERLNNGDVLQANSVIADLTGYYQAKLNSSTVGASGAVFGILAAFGYLFPNTYIYIYMLIPVKAKWVVLFYGALELYEGIKNSAGDNVAHWAHLGGAIVGLIIVITWNKTNRRTLY